MYLFYMSMYIPFWANAVQTRLAYFLMAEYLKISDEQLDMIFHDSRRF